MSVCLLSFFNLFSFESYLSCVCYICLQHHDAVTGMNLRVLCGFCSFFSSFFFGVRFGFLFFFFLNCGMSVLVE